MVCGIYQDMADDGKCLPPYPKLSPRLYSVVEIALRKAWEIVTADRNAAAIWKTADEDSLTLMVFEVLKDTLWQKRIIPGFDSEIFSTINREPKIRNCDGMHPDKMPDLLIEFREIPTNVRASQYGIYIECKPVDACHSVARHYCAKGIHRFLVGDYAWAMQDALMVGYASTSRSMEKHLVPKMVGYPPDHFTSSAKACRSNRSKEDSVAEQTLITTHSRNFVYQETGEASPEITLRHLWLKR